MSSPIRLNVVVVPSSNSLTGLEQLARQISDTMSGAVGGGFGQSSQQIRELSGNFGGLTNAITASRSALSTLYFGLRDIQIIGGALKSVLVDPFVDFTAKMLDATEQYRKFQVAITGVSGSFGQAGNITSQLVGASRNSPLTSTDVLSNLRGLIGAPGISQLFASGNTGQLANIANLASQASVLSPTGSEDDVTTALRNLLSGNTSQFQRRLGINPMDLAGGIGANVKQIQTNPQLALQAFEQYVQTYAGDQQFNQRSGLFTNATSKLADAGTQAFAKIGNSGAYDQLTDRVRGFTDQLMDDFDPSKNPRFQQQSQHISDAIVGIVDNIYNAISGLVQRASGSNQPIDSLAQLVTDIFDIAETATAKLPDALKIVGDFIHGLVMMAENLYQLTAHPLSYAASDAAKQLNQSNATTGINGYMASIDPRYGPAAAKINENNPWYYPLLGMSHTPTQADLQKYGTPAPQPKSPFDFSNVQGGLLDQIATPYSVQRTLQENLDKGMSGIGVRDQIQSLLNPFSELGVSDYQSKPEQTLSGMMNIPAQIAAMMNSEKNPTALGYVGGSGGYPALLAAAQKDLQNAIQFQNQFSPQAPVNLSPSVTNPFSQNFFPNNMQWAVSGMGRDKAVQFSQQNINSAQGEVTGVQNLPNQLVARLQGLADSIADQMNSLPGPAAAKLGTSLISNVDGLADALAKAMTLPPDVTAKLEAAVRSGPAALIDKIQTNTFNANLKNVQMGLPADGSLPATAQQLIASLQGQTPDSMDLAALNVRKARQVQLSGEYNNTQAQIAGGDNSQGTADALANISTEIADNQKALEQLVQKLSPAQQAFQEFANSVRNSFQTGIGNAIDDLITGTGNLRDAFKNMANDIISSFSQMASKQLVSGLVGTLGQTNNGGGIGGLGGLFGELLPGIRSATGGTAWTGDASNTTAMANGGIFPGHFMPFHAFATGGIASSPMFGLIGERGLSEAVVPLPDGRSLPVTMKGGSSPAIYVSGSYDEAIRQGMKTHRDIYIDVLSGEISKPGSKFNKAARNVGGN